MCNVPLVPQAAAAPAAMEEEDEGEVDETGVEPKDVELVMTQVRPAPRILYPVLLTVLIRFVHANAGRQIWLPQLSACWHMRQCMA